MQARWHDARMKDLNVNSSWADTVQSELGPETSILETPLDSQPPPLPEPPSSAPASPAADPVLHLSLWAWMREGLRAALFLAPRTGPASPTPLQLFALFAVSSALLLGIARLHVAGPARFNLHGWLAPMWTILAVLWMAWWAMGPAQRRASGSGDACLREVAYPTGGMAAWYALFIWGPLVPMMAMYALSATFVHWPQWWQGRTGSMVFWAVYGTLALWMLAIMVVASARFVRTGWRTGVLALGLVGVIGVGTWQFSYQPWRLDAQALAEASESDPDANADPEPARLELSQTAFEGQQALWAQQIQALAPQREGVVDVYGLVFAPYADEEVFRRESTMVSTLLQERFDAQGRVIHLLNHAQTAQTHAWATPQNLQRAIAALGARMDRENDVLVIYMTSHGARNHELAASHWPLQVPPTTPEMLRAALDEAGIQHRVIAISACYSGGWIEPLATDGSLIMTAADATHTSYGCGTRSELTFFGRAVFNEQLRQTHSFTEAFAKAVPLIKQREEEAGKADGFSNPQIHVGAQIEPVLKALEQRLAAGGADPATTAEAKP